jgi:hypothetical protein
MGEIARYLVVAVGLTLATPALASDYGCVAEWFELALLLLGLPAIVFGLLMAHIFPWTMLRCTALSWLLSGGLVLALRCPRGFDQDGLALLGISLGSALVAAVSAGQLYWASSRRAPTP